MTIIPAAQWMPDAGPLQGGSAIVQNVVPLTPDSYGPIGAPLSLQPYDPGVTDPPIGPAPVAFYLGMSAASFEGGLGFNNVYVFGTGGFALLKAGAWSAVTSSVAFNTPPYPDSGYLNFGSIWNFCAYKAVFIASSRQQRLLWLNASGTSPMAAPLSGNTSAPYGQFATAVADFLFIGNTYDPVGGVGVYRVWWSALGDPTTWPTPGSAQAQQVQSDYNDFADDLGQVTGLAGNLGNSDVAVFFERGIWRGIYTGPPSVFSFYRAQGTKGTRFPQSIVQVGSAVYYLGEDGFYAFDGINSTPIGVNRVDRWFFARFSMGHIQAAYDPSSRCVVWSFTSISNTTGLDDTQLFYSITSDRWSVAYNSIFGLFRTVSAIPDKAGFTIAQPGIALLMPDSSIGTFSGPPLAAMVSTVEQQPVPNSRAWCRSVRPLTDGGSPAVAIMARDRLSDPLVTGAAVAQLANGECPQRVDARYMAGIVTQPAGAAWSHIDGVDAIVQPSGSR